MMDGWDSGMSVAGWVFMTLFWVVFIALIVWVGARLFPARGDRDDDRRERPEELLDRRLARGDIDLDSYDRLREKLQLSRAERR